MKIRSLAPAFLLAGCSSVLVPVPDELKPGANESLAMIVAARGAQIYECHDGKWAFVAPEAELLDANGRRIGRHSAGPRWESIDGSGIAGIVRARADAPAPNAIPWLLLSAKPVGAEGAFSKVTSVQRVATAGGVAPSGGCSQTGLQTRVPYTAQYYFFSAR